jgi:hypothetical protein
VLSLLHSFLLTIQPLLVPICFVVAWGTVILTAWNIWSAVRDSVSKAREMHQIPCANCRYFTNDYHLKCTVHPGMALSEKAISCRDYESAAPTTTLTKV